jgi:hypothetical protein
MAAIIGSSGSEDEDLFCHVRASRQVVVAMLSFTILFRIFRDPWGDGCESQLDRRFQPELEQSQ